MCKHGEIVTQILLIFLDQIFLSFVFETTYISLYVEFIFLNKRLKLIQTAQVATAESLAMAAACSIVLGFLWPSQSCSQL